MGGLVERVWRRLHALNRFMRLPEGDRWLIVEAAFYLLCAKVATWATPPRTLLALGHVEPPALHRPRDGVLLLPAEVLSAVEAVDKSSARLPFANCLIRAIGLRLLLARREIATELHIGARKDEAGEFAAHAWLTLGDTILVGGEDATALYRELVGSAHTLLQ